jgi:hypothetical protein
VLEDIDCCDQRESADIAYIFDSGQVHLEPLSPGRLRRIGGDLDPDRSHTEEVCGRERKQPRIATHI